MKRLIRSTENIKATNYTKRDEVVDAIRTELKNSGCTIVAVGRVTEDCCKFRVVLPNDEETVITFSYDYDKIKNGIRKKISTLPWNSSYTISNDGHAYDKDGNELGEVKIIQQAGESQKYIRDYKLNSVKVDTGNIHIRHPLGAGDMNEVVEEIERRIVDVSSSK